MKRIRVPLLLAAGLAAACSSPPDRPEAPMLKEALGKATAPAPQKIDIAPTAPPPPNADLALANYRELLALNPDPDTRADVMRHMADIGVQMADARGVTDPQSEKDIQQSILTYTQILNDRPGAESNDIVLYQLAHANQLLGNTKGQQQALDQLSRDYPHSKFAIDAHFLLAEQYFQQGKFPAAEREYAAVLAQPNAAPLQREQSQYKYGFALYNQAEYEEAIAAFCKLLDTEVPSGAPDDPDKLIATLPKAKVDFVRDALHVISVSLSKLGDAAAIDKYFSQHTEPVYSPLIYNALGYYLLENRRYSDAAKVFAVYIERHPKDNRAPKFQSEVIDAYEEGGFTEAAIPEKERFAATYAPDMPYWGGREATPEVMSELRKQLEDVARYHHAKAQTKDPNVSPAEKRQEFLIAATDYRKLLRYFPKDPQAAALNLALADALLDGGETRAAAEEYERAAYSYPPSAKSADAGYAAVQAYDKLSNEVPADQRPGVRRLVAQSAVKFADAFHDRPERLTVLTRAAEDFHAIGDRADAIKTAAVVLAANPPAADPLRRSALAVTADSEFALGHYAQSEAADHALLTYIPASDPAYKVAEDQLAASIYKQGEAARASGNLLQAAQDFERVGQVAPTSSIHSNAAFDAAATYIQLKDWPNAERALEDFRAHYPDSPMAPDVDKKLAFAYQNDSKFAAAAAAYQRISQRPSESEDTRRESAWAVALMYDQGKRPVEARQAYEAYLRQYPLPLDRALDARSKLADISLAAGDEARFLAVQREIIAADEAGGAQRSDKSRAMAARATLQIGRSQARTADAIKLSLPLNKSVPAKKAATEAAIQTFNSAVGYGFGDVATQATYEIGALYERFGRALRDSERPRNLKGDSLEQYNLLLEEQVDPFVEKAIAVHETNLQRLKSNIYDAWVGKSVAALAELAPAKYGKNEQKDLSYESLR